MTTNLEGGGGKDLSGPATKKNTFLAASLNYTEKDQYTWNDSTSLKKTYLLSSLFFVNLGLGRMGKPTSGRSSMKASSM